ncbi:MAG: ATP phosphoribosyltransferase [Eubacteriaceae bacterium]|nr:ATP phosphoribosyltransferase [Eubacteriaceae bacterium]
MIRLAIAKGRISSEAETLLAQAGLEFPSFDDTRKLIISDKSGLYEVLLVKPADTAVYVETGVADCGIVGRDVIEETDPDVFRLFSMPFAQCKMCVAGKEGFEYKAAKKIVAASKYVRCAERHFKQKQIPCNVIMLNGSVEIAPLLDMSDVIVDIVQTGKTLKENGLVVLEEVFDIAPVFITNKAALKTKQKELYELIDILEKQAGISQ